MKPQYERIRETTTLDQELDQLVGRIVHVTPLKPVRYLRLLGTSTTEFSTRAIAFTGVLAGVTATELIIEAAAVVSHADDDESVGGGGRHDPYRGTVVIHRANLAGLSALPEEEG